MLDVLEPGRRKAPGLGRARRRWRGVLAAVAVVAAALLVRTFVLSPVQVASASMEPTIDTGDTVVVDKLWWRLSGLDHGDLVTFTDPQAGEHMVKRVVGLPGDEVVIEDAILKVNGVTVPEPYVDHSRIDALYFGPVSVADGEVFVLGDNRFGSIDSRVYGPVPVDAIDGRVLLILG